MTTNRPIRLVHREIDILAPEEVRRLMDGCSRRAPTGVRNRALIATLFGAGLRVSEGLSLRPKDLDLDGLAVTVHAGKGDKRRVAALLPDARDAVDRWLDRRRELGVGSQDVVFCTVGRGAAGPHPTTPGGRLSREYFARVLKRLARRAGIGKRVHPHALRHSAASLWRQRGWDVEEIRRQLDHLGAHDLPERMKSIGPVLEPAPDPRRELGRLIDGLDPSLVDQVVALLRSAVR
jgi:integrase/recombinase XerD